MVKYQPPCPSDMYRVTAGDGVTLGASRLQPCAGGIPEPTTCEPGRQSPRPTIRPSSGDIRSPSLTPKGSDLSDSELAALPIDAGRQSCCCALSQGAWSSAVSAVRHLGSWPASRHRRAHPARRRLAHVQPLG